MSPRLSLILLAAINLCVVVACGLNTPTLARTAMTKIQFVHYVEIGMPEQDVFIEPYNWLDDLPSNFIYPLRPHDVREKIPAVFIEPRSELVPNVVRLDAPESQLPAYLAKSLYATKDAIPHDAFKSGRHATGQFPKGDNLGLTARQWLAAQGSGTYSVIGNMAEFHLSFQKLVPFEHYTLECVTIPVRANADTVETNCPQWSRLHTGIQPDADGSATLRLRIPALRDSMGERTTILQLIYEREVTRWSSELGGYGWNQHVQLLFPMPALGD